MLGLMKMSLSGVCVRGFSHWKSGVWNPGREEICRLLQVSSSPPALFSWSAVAAAAAAVRQIEGGRGGTAAALFFCVRLIRLAFIANGGTLHTTTDNNTSPRQSRAVADTAPVPPVISHPDDQRARVSTLDSRLSRAPLSARLSALSQQVNVMSYVVEPTTLVRCGAPL